MTAWVSRIKCIAILNLLLIFFTSFLNQRASACPLPSSSLSLLYSLPSVPRPPFLFYLFIAVIAIDIQKVKLLAWMYQHRLIMYASSNSSFLIFGNHLPRQCGMLSIVSHPSFSNHLSSAFRLVEKAISQFMGCSPHRVFLANNLVIDRFCSHSNIICRTQVCILHAPLTLPTTIAIGTVVHPGLVARTKDDQGLTCGRATENR